MVRILKHKPEGNFWFLYSQKGKIMELTVKNDKALHQLLRDEFTKLDGPPPHIAAYRHKKTNDELYIHNGKVQTSTELQTKLKELEIV